ncbi:ABC transporter permease [Saliphagus sp. LR7]|uniref:ABC transporter permease n=1 Tax=Saliphagus sp. LR7 TaxID=2282654 RepID=UPI000DF75D48|nr:ABC transporter permease [Saliphagus sp. LR7]
MNWYVTRLIQALITFIAVIHITFFLMQSLPGGPADYLRTQLLSQGIAEGDMDLQEVNQLVELYIGINPGKSTWEQYVDYMSKFFLEGDMGTSLWYGEPVTEIYAEALPWTIYLMGSSTLLNFAIGIFLGAVMAYKEGSRFDISLTSIGIVLTSIPFYLFAILLLYVFAVQWNLFPLQGRYPSGADPEFTWEFFKGVIHHSVLPILSVVVTSWGLLALTMRGNSIRVLGEDYLRVARLRGLSDNVISIRYVGRNAILPLYTSLMISLGSLIGGSVILEQIFLYRGMGFYLYDATESRDYPLVMGGFILITLTVLIGIYFAELTYGMIDPRASEGGSHD